MMSIYEKTVNFVNRSFKGGRQIPHFEGTVQWLEKLYPQCGEAHRVAAYAHDIERAFRDPAQAVSEDYLDPEFLRRHQERGAQIIADFLRNNAAPEELVGKVVHLVSRHEVGGDEEQNALMNADSVSFFETFVQMFVEKKAPREGYASIKAKLDWMFDRITAPQARAVARSSYDKWVKVLNEAFPDQARVSEPPSSI